MQPSAYSEINPLQRWVNVSPLWLGAGVTLFFVLPVQPEEWVAWLLVLFLPLFWVARPRLAWIAAVLALFAVALGFVAALWQTERAYGPVLERPMNAVSVTGRVRDIVSDGKRLRLTLDQVEIAGLVADETPRRIRVSAAMKEAPPGIGQRVAMRATLSAPARPVMPGGFDFGRYFYFRGIGGIGYVLPPMTVLPLQTENESWLESLNDWMVVQRLRLKQSLMQSLPEPANAIAVALVTSDQSGISDELQQSMRVAGLTHILAISGAHMTIVCGMLYFTLRLLLAAIPYCALRWDIRKPAALVALIAGLLYLWLADFPVSAVRAYVMIAVLLSAVLVNREADALRSLALSAVLILLVQPSSLLEPGFQLSYAAVLALILFYRWWSRRREGEVWERRPYLHHAFDYVLGIVLTSLVAGLATAPIAAYHFHQIATYGLLANTLAIPLVTFVVTPALILALFVSPLGMEAPFLTVVDWGLQGMVEIAITAERLSGSMIHLPPLAPWGVALMIAGALLFLVARLPVRGIAVALVAGGMASAAFYVPPDMLVSGEGKAVAIRTSKGWELLKGTPRQFAVKEWMNALGADMQPGLLERCDRSGCVHEVAHRIIAMPRYERALLEDCYQADLVITASPYEGACPAALIGPAQYERHGTHAVWFSEDEVRLEHGCTGQAARPWNRCGKER